jgi:hypothetical protein
MNNWIKLNPEDKTTWPQFHQMVLCWAFGKDVVMGELTVDLGMDMKLQLIFKPESSHYIFFDIDDVTHWMPLPEPPEEG